MKKNIWLPSVCLFLVFVIQLGYAGRAESACAKVVLEIPQSLTMERVAFDAKLALANNVTDTALENVRLDIVIKDNEGNSRESLFFIRKPVLSGISALDGTGAVAPGGKAEAHWLIIPSPGAGVVIQNGVATKIGVDYWVGATLTYSMQGKQEVVPISPKIITVKPMPELVLDYFMPYTVIGDNPFTQQVEPPVPYPLAVRVLNDGYGSAMKLRIDSGQPKIVENEQGLLIDFKLLGASINDNAVSPSLSVIFGDVGSKKVSTAYWEMISTLSGRFIEFKAEFSHASELGGMLTSIIRETNAHYLTHMVKVNLPGRDGRLDFLADTNRDAEHLPDALFESEIPNGSSNMADARKPVTVVAPLAAPPRPTPNASAVQLSLPTGSTGWIYTRLPDPAEGLLKVLSVVRSDGVQLDPHNFWVDEGIAKDYKKTFTLQLLDYRDEANTPGAYTVTYVNPEIDRSSPTTSLIFDGPASGSGPFFVSTQTRIILSGKDNEGGSGVEGMFKKVAGQDEIFVAAYPFSFGSPGTYTVEYYSVDRAGNVEPTKSATFVVVGSAPSITAFTATPSRFAPQAPRGVKASRIVDLAVTATSPVAPMPVEIAVASGTSFQADKVVQTIKGSAVSGAELRLSWDGRNAAGAYVPSGPYVARIKVSDGLDYPSDPNAPSHTAIQDVAVTVADWFPAVPLDPSSADQTHPRVSGTRVVWQDQRNGNWDIYLKDTAGGNAVRITANSADQERPSIDGNRIVWQDNRSGAWDIYSYNLSTSGESAVVAASGDQMLPAVSGDWVAWQDNRNGNWDIYAYNFITQETVQITSHERDQIHPSISGTVVAWEDYRNGLGEIYQYDLATRVEARLTFDPENQTQPYASGMARVWTDERENQKNIYRYDSVRGSLRVTYGTGDKNQPAVLGDLLVYTDYAAGLDDPNLSFRLLSSGSGGMLTTNPARQEEPAVGSNLVAWQDTRDGKYQIYIAAFETETSPIEVELKPGFNLVAVGDWLATQFPTASSLIAAKGVELGIERLLAYDPINNSYIEASPAAGDFNLAKGMGLIIYVQKPGSLKLAENGDSASYTLIPGTNQIGMMTIPYGYSAYDLVRSIGPNNIQSVRRFDTATGAWQTVAVRELSGVLEPAGMNFTIYPGDGLVLTMKNRVDGWTQ